jgi:hypothetical protein
MDNVGDFVFRKIEVCLRITTGASRGVLPNAAYYASGRGFFLPPTPERLGEDHHIGPFFHLDEDQPDLS